MAEGGWNQDLRRSSSGRQGFVDPDGFRRESQMRSRGSAGSPMIRSPSSDPIDAAISLGVVGPETTWSTPRPHTVPQGRPSRQSSRFYTPWMGLMKEELDEISSMAEVRAQPQCLDDRRKLRQRLMTRSTSMNGGQVSEGFKETKKNTKKFLDIFRLRLWRQSIWKIESEFGSAVSSYFNFVKWIMGLNVITTVIVLLLIVAPQLVQDSKTATNDIPVLPDSCNATQASGPFWVPENRSSECCSALYETSTSDLDFDTDRFFGSLLNFMSDLLQGTNWMADTPLFYGYYSGTFVFTSFDITFDFPMAYLLVMVAVFVINLLAVVFSSAKSLHANYSAIQSEENAFNNLIFGGWDFRINKEKAVGIQKKDLNTRLDVAIKLKVREDRLKNMTRSEKWQLYLIRTFINLFVLATLVGSLILVFFITGKGQRDLLEENNCSVSTNDISNTNSWACFFINYLPSIVITILNMSLPMVYAWLIGMEQYSTNTQLVLTLARSITLRMLTLIITFLSVYVSVECDYSLGCLMSNGTVIAQSETGDCPANQMEVQSCSNIGIEAARCNKQVCWETEMGQVFYQLTFVDFFIQLFMVFLVDLPRVKIFQTLGWDMTTLGSFVGVIEFNISKNVLDIVFSQTICWLAIFFAPLITFVTLIKFFILFYVRMFYVFFICKPSTVPFSAARASSFFKWFLLISFFLCSFAVFYTLGTAQPSTACGPFRDVACNHMDGVCLVYDYIVQKIEEADNFLLRILAFLAEPAVLAVAVVALLMAVYYNWAFAKSQEKFAKALRADFIRVSKQKAINEQKMEDAKQQRKSTLQPPMM